MTFYQHSLDQLPVRHDAKGAELPPTATEVNRVLASLQKRLSAGEGRAGTTEQLGRLSLPELQFQPVNANSEVPLAHLGLAYYQNGELWAHERVPANSPLGVYQKVAIVQGVEQDGVFVGKASRFNFTEYLDATLDLANDRVNVSLDTSTFDARYVNVTGDTMSGNLIVGAAPDTITLETTNGRFLSTSDNAFQPFCAITNTNADANSAFLAIRKFSASPAVDDMVGAVRFTGRQADLTEKIMAQIEATSPVVTNSAAQGKLFLRTYTNDVASLGLHLVPGVTTVPTGIRLDAPATEVRVHRAEDTTVNTGAATVIPFNVEDHDTFGFHDNATNNSRLTVPTGYAGYYHVTGEVTWDNTTTAASFRTLTLERNAAGTSGAGTTFAARRIMANTDNVDFAQGISGTIYLAEGDYVEMFAATGENTNVMTVDRYYDSPTLEMFRVGTL